MALAPELALTEKKAVSKKNRLMRSRLFLMNAPGGASVEITSSDEARFLVRADREVHALDCRTRSAFAKVVQARDA